MSDTKIKKVTYEDLEIEAKIQKVLEGPDNKNVIEVCCYPMTDGCCIKKGTSS